MLLKSDRQQVLYDLEQCLKCSAFSFLLNEAEWDGDDAGDDSNSVDKDAALDIYVAAASLWSNVWSQRYFNARSYRYKVKDFLAHFMEETDESFRTITRVNKQMFQEILSQIQDHDVFKNNSNCPQWDIAWQLYIALDRLGHCGQGNSLARSRLLWDVGHGTIHEYTGRVITAILSLEARWVRWPNANKRAEISSRMAAFGFKHCVGFVDGTSLPLHRKPSHHRNIYMNRKFVYSISAQVVVNDRKQITHFQVGDPGSSHDSLVFADSPLVKVPHLCFSENQYLIGNSAYGSSNFLISAYKENQKDDPSDPLESKKIEIFNTILAKARVRNEHAIGLLKGRWNFLTGLRIIINEVLDVHKVNRCARACVVLHNMCMGADPWTEMDLSSEPPPPQSTEGDMLSQRSDTVGKRKRHRV